MRTQSFSIAAGLGLLLSSSQAIQAGFIFSQVDVRGPGLVDVLGPRLGHAHSDLPSTGGVRSHPDNQSDGGAALGLTARFVSVGEIRFLFRVVDSPTTTEYAVRVDATNRTDFAWTDFHIELGFIDPGNVDGPLDRSRLDDFLDFDTPDRDPVPSSGLMTLLNHQSNIIDFGLPAEVPVNTSTTYFFNLDVPNSSPAIPNSARLENGYVFALSLTPSVPPERPIGPPDPPIEENFRRFAPVPEPSSILLLAFGVSGCLALPRLRGGRVLHRA